VEREKEFNQQGEDTSPARVAGRPGRRAAKWFSYDLPVDPAHELKLIVTYHTEERANRAADIIVEGTRVGEQTIERYRPGSSSGRFFDVEYAVPAEAVKGKAKISVRFEAKSGSETPGVYGVRVVRADAIK
jgi:hypothetical protein